MGGLFQNSGLTTTAHYMYNTVPDVDAQAFITAASITDGIQKIAINTLVADLKYYNIWTKYKALYPFVGGTAAAHKFNLKNPADTNGAYRLTFTAGWTHSRTGALPNGSAYAETYLVPSTTLTNYNTHLSYYSRTNLLETTNFEIGSYNGSGGNIFSLVLPRNTGNASSTQYDQFTATNYALATGQTSTTGFWMSNRTSNVGSTHKLWRNGVSIAAASTTGGSMLTNTIWIGAINNTSSPPAYYSRKECAFASIGDGLTDAEALIFNNIVQKFQGILGRQV